ncbi:MAG: DUF975 family protein [Lachnospiraceae bacterium]|nr:DUF975 family protein [Lachnospiraceae bacterium]
MKGLNIMQQPQYKSNYEIKFLARMQTSQHMGILIGAILLKFIITVIVVNIVSMLIPTTSTTGYVINYILVFIVQVGVSVLNVGTSFIFLKSACSMTSSISDLFCGFQQNTVKILKISAVITVIDSICMIPLDIASIQYNDIINSIPFFREAGGSGMGLFLAGSSIDSHELLEAYSILYNASMKLYLIIFVCAVISLILTLPFFPAFYMILDFPDWSATTILKKSFEVMSGNKFRLFVLYLSFIPSFLLSIFTCGISLIWVIPYLNMALTNFYLDIMTVRNKTLNSNIVC